MIAPLIPLQGFLAGGVFVFVTMVLLVLAIAVAYSSVVIIRPYQKGAYTVLGTYRGILDQGIHFIYPFVSDVTRFDMRTQTLDVPRQEAITRDNSPVTADAVVYIKVMDPKKAFLEVDNYERAVSNLAQTTLRAVLGDMELDEPTDEWGVRVESVEVREVNPSKDVQQAMEQQTSAERKRRAMILEAQGERRSAIEKAQGDTISTVLRAKSAESMGERAVIDKGMETLESIGQGESTTFVLPQELSSMLGRYGKHLTGSDVKEDNGELDSLDFDAETRELIGLDNIEEILGQIDEEAEMDVEAMEQEAQAIKEGEDPANIKSADEVIEEMDEEAPDVEDMEAEMDAELEK